MFKVMRTGKRKSKMWKRMITKVTFVGDGFTRKPPKYERFIRPRALRFKKAHVTHPELKVTTNMHQSLLPVIGLSLPLCSLCCSLSFCFVIPVELPSPPGDLLP